MSGSVIKVVVFAALVAGAYGGYAAYRAAHDDGGNNISEPSNSGPVVLDGSPQSLAGLDKLTLIERSGANFRFESLKGKVWVANSFFSNCPGECKMLTAVMRSLQNEFPELRLVSMTSDPTNDKPAVLKAYATENGADPTRWLFVTGNAFDLQTANMELLADNRLGMKHSTFIALVDTEGKWQAMHSGMDLQEFDKLREKIRKLLAAAP